ncbi:peroxiredoxin family protein [Pedobacter duraquae]|uniref:peroxiredoxin family protein n=1 Tax=Pedobacter duraquae TaxID=425511 RepID=UPI001415216D|nr:TlpA disulfide reductase family protein [Pedobacter duraquae]
MNTTIKLLLCIVLCQCSLTATAQINILQNSIDKLAGYTNFSYDYVYKQKEAFGDTLILNQRFELLKKPEDKEIGYFFRQELKYGGMKIPTVSLYNGKNLTTLTPDSTYSSQGSQKTTFNESLLAELSWIKTFAEKQPSKFIQSGDTVINSIKSYHLILSTRDTVVNNAHVYTRIHLFINKITGLPAGKLIRSRSADFGKEITDYYVEFSYFNFKTDLNTINTAYFAMPEGYHVAKKKSPEETAPLQQGTKAPDWTLSDSDGNKVSLSQLRGKVVLLDFFFVGCVPCLKTLAPLDKLYEKYSKGKLAILSISIRDSKKLVAEYKATQRIKNQVFPDGGNVAKLYHVNSFPTVYIVDRDGKITNVVSYSSDDFEKKMSGIIDGLIKKS